MKRCVSESIFRSQGVKDKFFVKRMTKSLHDAEQQMSTR